VNEHPETKEEPRPPAGVIACLTSAFELLAHAPQLLLPPVLLDLFLWLGPRLPARSLVAPLIAAAKTAPSAEFQPLYQGVYKTLTEFGANFDLFATLSPAPLLGTPVLMGMRKVLSNPLGARIEIPVPTVGASLVWIAMLTILGLGISAFYLTQVGRHVVTHTAAPVPGPTALPRLWGQLLRLTVTLLFIISSATLTASLVMSIGIMISRTLISTISLLFLSLGLFIGVHFIYTIPGMVQLRHTPLHAMQESVLLARVDFAGVMQLLLLTLVLTQGLNFVWSLPEPDTWAAIVGIGGHAVINTALTVTLFIFYQERLAYLRLLQSAFARNAAQATRST